MSRPRDSLPAVDAADLPDSTGEAAVHGVVLAAGTSTRYGAGTKLTETVDGEPLVARAAAPLLAAAVDGVTVVAGYEADRVAGAVAHLDVSVRHNDAFAEGQGTSVAAGVRAARERGADAVVVALGDMPAVSPASVNALLSAYAAGAGTALAATHDGTRGNPVLFDSQHFEDLAALDGDAGGRAVLLSAPDAVAVAVDDPGVLHDVDRPGDL